MANFTVSIAIKAADMASGVLKKTSASASKSLGGLTKTIQANAAQFRQAGVVIAGVGASITAALGAAGMSAMKYADDLATSAERMGVNVKTLSELTYAADLADVSQGELSAGLRRLSRSVLEASRGTMTYKRSFDALGVSVTDQQGNIRNFDDVISDVADKIAVMPEGFAKTALAQEIFGRGGAALLPLLNMGSEGIAKLRKEAEELGLSLDEETLKAMAATEDSLKRMKWAFKGLTVSIGEVVLPTIEALWQRIAGVAKAIGNWARAHPRVTSTLLKLAGAIGVIASILGPWLVILPSVIFLWAKFRSAIGDCRAAVAQIISRLKMAGGAAVTSGAEAGVGAVGWRGLAAGIWATTLALIKFLGKAAIVLVAIAGIVGVIHLLGRTWKAVIEGIKYSEWDAFHALAKELRNPLAALKTGFKDIGVAFGEAEEAAGGALTTFDPFKEAAASSAAAMAAMAEETEAAMAGIAATGTQAAAIVGDSFVNVATPAIQETVDAARVLAETLAPAMAAAAPAAAAPAGPARTRLAGVTGFLAPKYATSYAGPGIPAAGLHPGRALAEAMGVLRPFGAPAGPAAYGMIRAGRTATGEKRSVLELIFPSEEMKTRFEEWFRGTLRDAAVVRGG